MKKLSILLVRLTSPRPPPSLPLLWPPLLPLLLLPLLPLLLLHGCGEEPAPKGPPLPAVEKGAAVSARPGEQLLVRGSHLGEKGMADLGPGKPVEVASWTDTSVLLRLPADIAPGPCAVYLTAGATRLGPVAFTVLRPGPVLEEVRPPRARIGQTIEVTGKYLGSGPGEGKLFFYGTPVTQPESWTDTSIRFRIPKPGNHPAIWVEVGGAASGELYFTLARPQVDAVEPAAVLPGESATARGKDFGETPGRLLVGLPPVEAKVTAWTNERIDFQVPPDLTGEVTVKVENDAGVSIPTTMQLLRQPPDGPIGATPYEGKNAALALDARGFPWVAYYDPSLTTLELRHWNGAAWAAEEPPVDRPDLGKREDSQPSSATVSAAAALDLTVAGQKVRGTLFVTNVGPNPSIAVDRKGRLHVTCQDVFRQRLQYGLREASGAWHFTVVDEPGGAAGLFSSVKADAEGVAHIAFMESDKGELRYATRTKDGFDVRKVDEGHVGITVSLALDARGTPHMAYLDYTNFDLRYARLDDKMFRVEKADAPGWVGDAPSIAFDSKDRVAVAYGERDEGGDNPIAMRFATRKADRWEVETIEKETGTGAQPNLAVDSKGRARVVYTDLRKKEIHDAIQTRTGWAIQKIPVPGMRSVMDAGECRMVMGKDDRPRVVYWDEKPSRLVYKVLDARAGEGQ